MGEQGSIFGIWPGSQVSRSRFHCSGSRSQKHPPLILEALNTHPHLVLEPTPTHICSGAPHPCTWFWSPTPLTWFWSPSGTGTTISGKESTRRPRNETARMANVSNQAWRGGGEVR